VILLTGGIDDAALFLNDNQILSERLVGLVLCGAYNSELRLVVDQGEVRLDSLLLYTLHSSFGLFF